MPRGKAQSDHALRSRVEATSKRYQELANRLSDRIKRLNDWVNQLPSKTAAEITLHDPKEPSVLWFLAINRVGPGWGILWGRGKDGDSSPVEMSPLVNAPLEVKINLIPDLFTLFEFHAEYQVEELEELAQAHNRLDRVFHAIGLDEAEGA